MNIPGKRITLHKWLHSGPIAVRVAIEAVVPEADAAEPCLEPATLRFLDEVQRLANEGNADALSKFGDVYIRRSA